MILQQLITWVSGFSWQTWMIIIVVGYALSIPSAVTHYKRQRRLDKYFAGKRKKEKKWTKKR